MCCLFILICISILKIKLIFVNKARFPGKGNNSYRLRLKKEKNRERWEKVGNQPGLVNQDGRCNWRFKSLYTRSRTIPGLHFTFLLIIYLDAKKNTKEASANHLPFRACKDAATRETGLLITLRATFNWNCGSNYSCNVALRNWRIALGRIDRTKVYCAIINYWLTSSCSSTASANAV